MREQPLRRSLPHEHHKGVHLLYSYYTPCTLIRARTQLMCSRTQLSTHALNEPRPCAACPADPHANLRGGAEGFVGVVGWSLKNWGEMPVVPQYTPSWVHRAGMHLAYEPSKRVAVGLWINNCGPRRAGLADLLLHAPGLRVESYGTCRHNTPEGAEYWGRPGNRLRDATRVRLRLRGGSKPLLSHLAAHVPSYVIALVLVCGQGEAPNGVHGDGTHPALVACRRHRLILAEENELCEGYYTFDLVHAIKVSPPSSPYLQPRDGLVRPAHAFARLLVPYHAFHARAIKVCGAIPIVYTAGGLPDYHAELGHFPLVNASRSGWMREVVRLMHDDAYYRSFLLRAQREGASAPPGAFLETSDAFHCQWHDLRLDERPRRRVQWPMCVECVGDEEAQVGDFHIQSPLYHPW